jgi:hypothetical protein
LPKKPFHALWKEGKVEKGEGEEVRE